MQQVMLNLGGAIKFYISNRAEQFYLLLGKRIVFSIFVFKFYHFVNRGDNLQHLPSRDEAVLVQVVHAEGPLQLVLELAPRGYTEGANAKTGFVYTCTRSAHLRAQRNSRKSIVPSPLASNVRKTCSANFPASPYGKKLP